MHDASALFQYRPDSVIEDVDDHSHPAPRRSKPTTSQPIARGRVATGDLTVHVQLDDGWHRLDPAGSDTACPRERPFEPRLELGRRIERVIEHPLADCECWTSKERAKADANYLSKFGMPYVPWKRK
jgi:hypothetical protein